MANLIDTILGAVPRGTIDNLAGQLGESPQATGSALSGIIPVVLGAMAGKVQGGDAGGVTNMISGALSGGNPLDNPTSLLGGLTGSGGGIASSLLGGSFGPIATTLAERFGLKADSIKSLLGFAGLASAGGIGRLLGGNPTPQGLTDLFRNEQSSINAAMPSGIGGLLGSIGGTAREAMGATATRVDDVATAAGSGIGIGIGKWLPWLILALLAIAAFIGLKSCKSDPAATVTNTTEQVTLDNTIDNVTDVAPTPAAAPTGAGVVSEMRDNKPALIVYFDVGKSDVTKDLAAAASGVKDYVAANAGTKLAVSGFNDPTGNAAANEKLSKRRAEQVAAALKETGIPADAISLEKPAEASGTGSTNAESRRVEVTVK